MRRFAVLTTGPLHPQMCDTTAVMTPNAIILSPPANRLIGDGL